MINKVTDIKDKHYKMTDKLVAQLQKNKFNVTLKEDVECKEEDTQNQDLVISMGGDWSYLHTAAMVTKPGVAYLGINSVNEQAKLCEEKLEFDGVDH